MLVTVNLVVIFVSSSLGLPLSQDKPLPNSSQRLPVTSKMLSAISQAMPAFPQKLPETLRDLPTKSPPPAEAKARKQSQLVKKIVKVMKEQAPGIEQAVKMKTRNGSKKKTSSGRAQSRRRRMRSRRRRIPLCMGRCLSLGLLHPAQCHSLCS